MAKKTKKTLSIKKPEIDLTPRYKKELNEEQLKVVLHKKGPALVIAGAGSGKTRALTYRVAYLVEKGVPPESIVLVTFTKKAAREMVDRVERLVGAKAKKIKAGTFHHISNLILRKYARSIEFDPGYTILDSSDQKSLMKNIRASMIPENAKQRYPKTQVLLRIVNLLINQGILIPEILETRFPQFIEEEKWIQSLISKFKKIKKENNVMDFDDMMIYFLEFLVKAEASHKVTKQIRHVLVDEYQDVNLIQARIVEELSRDAQSLTVVGDDAQAIYSFRGADFTHMLNFPDNNPMCQEFRLETNYRSTPEILNLANASINFNKNQFKKALKPTKKSGELPALVPCRDLEQEADLICSQIIQHSEEGIQFHKQAVLFRAKFHSISLERALVRWKIPYEVRAGLRFFEMAHIKDILAFLMIISNPKDEIQWQRILGLHPMISGISALKIISEFEHNSELNAIEQFVRWDLLKKMKGKRIRKVGIAHLKKLQDFLKDTILDENHKLIPEDNLPPISELISSIRNYCTDYMMDIYQNKHPEDRLRDIDELAHFSSQYLEISSFLGDILTQLDLTGESIEDGDKTEEEEPLVISTIHQSKGLEWDVVYVMNLVQGRMPSSQTIGDPDALEEERRLFYVACTRARDSLFLTYPRFVPSYNQDIIQGPSEFIEEIRDHEVLEVFDVEEE